MSLDALLRQMAETSNLEKQIMTTTNQPNGMPKECYRSYRFERAGGIELDACTSATQEL
jgi:hypothetical protein